MQEGLINGLKISSKGHLPVTMYQVSPKGLDALRQVSRVDKDAVHRVVFSPQRNLMIVTWDGDRYFLKSEGCARARLALRFDFDFDAVSPTCRVSDPYRKYIARLSICLSVSLF